MEYHGKLYGKYSGKYFDTGKTAKDFDTLEKENKELKQSIAVYCREEHGKENLETDNEAVMFFYEKYNN